MFRSATDHHQEFHVFLVKITELKCEYSKSSGSSSPLCLYISKEGGGLCIKTQLSWICIFIVEIRLHVSALLDHLQAT
jgi:hypothetical protein